MATKSIAKSLEEQGLRVWHSARYGMFSHLREPDPFFYKFDYFLDGNLQNFAHLHNWFPDAKFVLLERDIDNWARSIFLWQNSIENHMKEEKYVYLIRLFIANRFALLRMLEDLLIYQKRAKEYFKEHPNFMVLDIEKEQKEGWKRLSDFLEIPLESSHINKQTNKINPDWLTKFVDRAKKNAQNADVSYPILKENYTLSTRLFIHSSKILAHSFNKQKFLFKNINASITNAGGLSISASREIVMHIGGFIKILFFLGLRLLTIRKRVVTPFLI
ncbi:MAG: hypothetical protein MI700_04490 [Balneolales bacterium]|nr:hypothetical protein [Balneolales bacterium]